MGQSVDWRAHGPPIGGDEEQTEGEGQGREKGVS